MKYKISTAIIIISSLLVSVFVFGGGIVRAEYREIDPANFAKEKSAVLFFTEPIGTIDGKYKTKLMIDTGGQSANAIFAELNFPIRSLRAESLDTDNSICDFFLEDSFNNEQGTMNIACGKPYPGFNGVAEVVEITFSTIEPTIASFDFTDAMVLANDGFATNILKKTEDKVI